MRFLAPLGVPGRLFLDPGKVNFRFVDWDRRVARPTALEFRNVSRFGFDRWLTSEIPDSVDVMEGTSLVSAEQTNGAVDVVLREGARRLTAQARYLIGADGARSKVRECLLGADSIERYLAIQDWVPRQGALPSYFDCIGTRTLGDGFAYGYVMPKGDLGLVGSVFYPGARSLPSVHERFKEEVSAKLPLGSEVVRREGAAALRVCRPEHVTLGRGNIMLVGEAAGLISPTSGEGISYALNSGDRCGRAIAEGNGDAAELYREMAAPIVKNIRTKIRKLPFLENRLSQIALTYVPYRILSRMTMRL